MKLRNLLLGLCLTVSYACADPILDGVVTPGEYAFTYGPYMPYINGSDGATQTVRLYYTPGATYAYGAVVADPTKPVAFPGANIYFYSGSLSVDSKGNFGSYGDGNDILIEGASRYGNASPNPPYLLNPVSLNQQTNGNLITGSANGVSVVINTATDVEEFRIPISLLADPSGGQYALYRFGGQFFTYEFQNGGDRLEGPLVPGSVTAVVTATPEPSSLALFSGAALLLGSIRRFRRKNAA